MIIRHPKNIVAFYSFTVTSIIIGLCYSSQTLATNSPTHIEFDGSTGTETGIVNDIADGVTDNVFVIDSIDGSGQGANLFHSFEEFSIGNGDTALFTDSTNTDLSNPSFDNVILRVTGGNESTIYGNIKAGEGLDKANFFLLNPTGIVFGEGASIDIGGSFYASTADQLIFDRANNEVMATGTTSSTFYAAPIEAFGFISPNPASITVTDTSLVVNEGKQLSLIGGEIILTGKFIDAQTQETVPTLQATDGIVQIASIAGQGDIAKNISEYEATTETVLGKISMSKGAHIDTSGTSGGQIVIRGGNLSMAENSALSNNISGASQALPDQAGIDIFISGNINLYGQARIAANSGEGAISRSDGIKIVASNLSLSNSSVIESTMADTSQVFDAENHHEGLIDIKVNDTIDINTDSSIGTVNRGIGEAAAIDIRTDTLLLTEGGIIDASAYSTNASGRGGDISIKAHYLQITGAEEVFAHKYRANKNTGIQSNGAHRRGANTSSGDIDVNAQHIVVSDNGIIQANSYGTIRGGDINLNAETGSIELLNGGRVRSQGKGTAGNIFLNAGNITISGATLKKGSTKTQRSGLTNQIKTSDSTSGNIIIETKKLTVTDGARITTLSTPDQTGGNIIISADEINISGINEKIFAKEYKLLKEQKNPDAKQEATEFAATSIDTTASTNSADYNDEIAGGNIILTAKTFDLSDQARISTQTLGLAKEAGNIEIRADDISIRNNSEISTEQQQSFAVTTNRANGNISILANHSLVIERSKIATTVTSANGRGGDIFLGANKLYLNAAILDTSTKLGGGGNITVISSQSLITPDTIFYANSESSINGIIDIQNLSQDIQNINHTPLDRHKISVRQVTACELNKSINSSTLFVGPINETQNLAQYGGMNIEDGVSVVNNEHLFQTPLILAHNNALGCIEKSIKMY